MSIGKRYAHAVLVVDDEPFLRIVIQMPGSMDSLRLTGYIHDAYPPIALIISSGAIEPAQSALPADAIFMPKPIDHDALPATLNELADHA